MPNVRDNPDNLTNFVQTDSDPERTTLIDDEWLANRTKNAKSTYRVQRWKRRHRQEHWFAVDPVYVGRNPRYRLSDVLAWLDSLEAQAPSPKKHDAGLKTGRQSTTEVSHKDVPR